MQVSLPKLANALICATFSHLSMGVIPPWRQLVDVCESAWERLHAQAAQHGPRSKPDQLVFQFQCRQPRRVHMPRPFAALTASLTERSKGSVPSLLRPRTANGSNGVQQQPEERQERILISEVEIVGVEGELQQIARDALKTRPNFAYTINEVKQDVARVFATGWFRECLPDAQDTRDGVKLILKVTPNDVLQGMVASGTNVLPASVVESTFKEQYGRTLNYCDFKKAVSSLDRWYADRGYLGQVTDYEIQDGVLHLSCAEAVVGDISLTFMDPATKEPAATHRTRPPVILRHLTTQPGQVYNLKQAQRDIAAIYSTGLFEDVTLTPKESEASTEAAPKVDLLLNVVERKTGGLGAGGGLSTQARTEGALPGFVGSFTYTERNLFGLNQKLSAMVELGQVDKIFKVQHTDPWILGDRHRTSRTLQLLNNRSSGVATHGRAEPSGPSSSSPTGSSAPQPSEADASGLVIGRLISGVEWRRPLGSCWSATWGGSWQRLGCQAAGGSPLLTDCYGAPLTASRRAVDHMACLATSAAYGNPDADAGLLVSAEAGLPLVRDWLKFARLRVRADKSLPLLGPLSLHLGVRGGLVLGDLPPYDAFPVGGTNSVRGYADGGVGTGRRWLEGSSELRFPLVAPLSAQLFADWGSDLGSGAAVLGNPAGVRGKPGHGYGYGGGVRIDTPVGPLRLEYAWNATRAGRFHVGVGYD